MFCFYTKNKQAAVPAIALVESYALLFLGTTIAATRYSIVPSFSFKLVLN